MYSNSYMNPYNSYNQQSLSERIDNQISQLQQMKEQMKNQQPAINQTFQLAPTHNTMRYANTIDDVNKEVVYSDTPFFSKDMSVLWVKNTKNEIKTYELSEIIPKDSKDMQIEYLQEQIRELKGMIKNDEHVTNGTNGVSTEDEPDTTGSAITNRTTTKKSKSTSI